MAATLGTPLLRAHAARAAGAVLGAEGDPKAALVELRSAFNEFHALGVRYDAARTRLLIAEACAALGDHDTAAMESSAARAVLDSLATAEILSANVEPASSRGSHPTRAGDPAAPRPRQDQPGNRARARHQRKDGGEPREPHLHQARRHLAKRRHRLRLRPRPRRIAPATTSFSRGGLGSRQASNRPAVVSRSFTCARSLVHQAWLDTPLMRNQRIRVLAALMTLGADEPRPRRSRHARPAPRCPARSSSPSGCTTRWRAPPSSSR